MGTSNLIGLFENVWYRVVVSCPLFSGTTSLLSCSSIWRLAMCLCVANSCAVAVCIHPSRITAAPECHWSGRSTAY